MSIFDEMKGDRMRIVIIGAGIVGVSTALWLLRDGHSVTLVDREGPASGTSYGNAGVLASNSIVPVTQPGLIKKAPRMALDPREPLFLKWGYLPRLLPWLVKYLRHANQQANERIASALVGVVGDSLNEHLMLARGTPAARHIQSCDYVYAYDDRKHFKKDAFAWRLRKTHGFDWEEREGDAYDAYDTALAGRFGFGVRCPEHGRITDPGQYVKDLAAAVEAEGGEIRIAEVQDIVCENGKVVGVQTTETIPCDAAVITTGAWSWTLCAKLGFKVPLESERGYHMEFWEPSIMPTSPTMIAARKFVLTPMEGRLRAAGIVEFGGLKAGPSAAPFKLLEENVKAALPGLTYKEKTTWMGHRPATSDSIPVIGEIPGAKGAFTGFGHHHIGLTAGPKTGRLLAQMISGRKPNLDVSVYSPTRFSS